VVSTDKDSAGATGTMNDCDTDALSLINKTASNHTSSRPGSEEESHADFPSAARSSAGATVSP